MEIWRFCDGKAGHERQTAGLIAALGKHRILNVRKIPVGNATAAWWQWLCASWPLPAAGLPPAFLVGAGRACQWPLIAARRSHGGRTIYCMKPALPTSAFDLCLVPQHDDARKGLHVEPTFGVLNDVQPGPRDPAHTTLILVGGPSRHYAWNDAMILAQVANIVARAEGPCTITDSRRTPTSTREALAKLATPPNVSFHTCLETPTGWLTKALAGGHQAWVTTDSVSMIFEALTAGLGVGLIELPDRRNARINRLTASLVQHGQVTAYQAWQQGEPLNALIPPLNEAARCADLILARWPS